jgi:hypothetical protein
MWLEKYGRKPVNPVAAFTTVVGVLLGFVSFDSGGVVLPMLSGVLFLGGMVFLDGFRLREVKREEDDDLPGPQALF